jgi:hypothetical protein
MRSSIFPALLLWFLTLAALCHGQAQLPLTSTMGLDVDLYDFVSSVRKAGNANFLKATGVSWIRTDTNWKTAQHVNGGPIDFTTCHTPIDTVNDSCLDEFITDVTNAGLTPYLILDYSNPAYDPVPEQICAPPGSSHPYDCVTSAATVAGFINFATTLIGTYQGKHIVWELWNEPNDRQDYWPDGSHPPNVPANIQYQSFALQVSQAIHQAFSSEYIVGPALGAPMNQPLCSQADLTALDNFLGCSSPNCTGVLAFWSGVSVHFYRGGLLGTSNPETVACDLRNVQNHVNAALSSQHLNKTVDYISGEWGYVSPQPMPYQTVNNVETYARGADENSQASYLTREFVYNSTLQSNPQYNNPSLPSLKLSNWFAWHDTTPVNGLGIMRFTQYPADSYTNDIYSPKPAYLAATTIATYLGSSTAVCGSQAPFYFDPNTNHSVLNNSAYISVAFTNGSEERYVVWTTSSTPQQVQVPVLSAGEYFMLSNLGLASSYQITATNSINLQVTGSPQFIISPSNPRTCAVYQMFHQVLYDKDPTPSQLQTYSNQLGAGVPVSQIVQSISQLSGVQTKLLQRYAAYQYPGGVAKTPYQMSCSTNLLATNSASLLTVTDYIRAYLINAQPALSSLLSGSSLDRVYYTDCNLHIHDLWWNGTTWHTDDISNWAGAYPAATNGGLSSFVNGGIYDVQYIGSDQHVRELWWDGNNWQTDDLVQWTGAPNAALGSPVSSLMLGNFYHVFYLTSGNHVQELWWDGSTWRTDDLNQWTGASNPVSGSSLSSFIGASILHLYYITSAQHVQELWWDGSNWHTDDLTQWAGAPTAGSASALTSVILSSKYHVYFITANQHVDELWWDGSNWHFDDLNQWIGAPTASAGTALTSFIAGSVLHAYYMTTGSHIQELWWDGTNWHTDDLTQWTGAPLASTGSALTSLLNVSSYHVEYVAADQHVHEFWWDGTNWQVVDLNQWTGAPD